jgi:bacillithiol biosynthesis cysteine-adding enzyme BshC
MEPALRRLMVPLLEEVLEAPLRATHLVNEAGEALTERGFSPQVHKQECLCPFYLYGSEGERTRLACEGEAVRGPERTWSLEALRRLLRREPERFSLSLILRPVMQDYLFPTAVFLGGPGEMAYFAQLRGVYAWLGVAPPLVMPRFTATLVEPRVRRILQKYDLHPRRLRGDVEAFLHHLVRERFGGEAEERFAAARRDVEEVLAPLLTWVRSVDPNLTKPGQQLRARIAFELDKLLQKTVRALKRQHDLLMEQVRTAAASLYPQRQLQERLLNPYAFWVRYGPSLRERLRRWPIEEALGVHLFLECA